MVTKAATVITALLVLWLSMPQQTPISAAAVHDLARRDDKDAQLVTFAKQQTDTLRAALSQALRQSALTRSAAQQKTELNVARRLARAYAVAWSDPFLVRQIARFETWSPRQQHAKLKADSLRKAGNGTLGQRGVPAAMQLWRASLQQANAAGDSAGQAATLGNLGAGFYRAGQLDSAQVYLTRSRRLATVIGDLRATANAIGVLANVHKDRGDLAQAADLYGSASALRERSGDRRGLAADQNNLGLIARDLGDLTTATRSFQRAFVLNTGSGSLAASALNLLNLAGIASTLGDYARADQLYGQALAVQRSMGNDAEKAYVLHERALLRIRRGDYAGAEADLREALRLHEAAGAPLDAAAVRRDLASVLMAAGDPQNALAMLRQAEDQAHAANAPATLRADIARAHAEMDVDLNEFEAASEYYTMAERLYHLDGNDAGLGAVADGRGVLFYIDRNYPDALVSLMAAKRAHIRARDARAAALTQLSIAYTQMQLADTVSARRSIAEARRTLHDSGDVVGEAATLQALGDLALERHTPVAAEQFYRAGMQKLGERAATEVRWRLYAGLGSALRQQRALGPAVQQLRAAVSEIERSSLTLVAGERRISFMADKLDVYAQLALAERARGDVPAAFATSERMRAQQMLALLARGRVTTSHRESGHEQDLRRQIAELMHQLNRTADDRSGAREALVPEQVTVSAREALYRAQTTYARLLTEVREQDPGYAAVVNPVTASAASIARQLRADEVMIDYLVTDSTTLAFVITKRGVSLVNLDVARRTLAPLIDFAVRVTQKHDASASSALWQAPLARLYDYLIAPLELAGYLNGKRSVIIVPHAELHFVPFAALVNRQRRNFLINAWELSYAPSASVWSRLRERSVRRANGVVALAPRTDVLPFSAVEVDGIRRIYGRTTTVLVGRAASQRALRTALPHAGIVHLATLGILNKHNPLFSFVALGGAPGNWERLEVHEVFGLGLNGQLIVLSACQTALASGALADVPPGDDWTGLVQAFLAAGAGSVVASLWAVNDRATAQLMAAFHERIRSGRSDAAALAEAQRAAIRNSATAQPFYWAAFTVHSGS